MTLPDWLSDEGVRCFRVPEHVCIVEVDGGCFQASPPVSGEIKTALHEAWERLKDNKLDPHTPISEPVQAGIYCLVAEEGECPKCGGGGGMDHPSGLPPCVPCDACGCSGDITTHRLIREDAEELEVPFAITTDRRLSLRPDDGDRFLLLGPAGQRHEVKR